MAGNNKQKKSFSFFSFFKGKNHSSWRSRSQDDYDDYMKAYKIYPGDEDRGTWSVAEPGIDSKASAYISSTTHKWQDY